MRLVSPCSVLAGLVFFTPLLVQAQDVRSTTLAVGSGSRQIGLVATPNEECRGPVTVTPAEGATLAVLDSVNHKIVLVGGGNEDIPLPRDLIEPSDVIANEPWLRGCGSPR
jgi:hypothetical protein